MLANLRALFGVVVDIVLLRRGPEHLPASPALLAAVIAIYLVVYSVLTILSPNVPPIWVLPLLMAALIAVLWFRAGLVAAKKRERFTQTTAAYFAATTMFLPVLVPLESVDRLVDKVRTGDELEVHLDEQYVLNKTRGERYALRPLGDVLPIIEAGGIFEYARQAGMLK